MGVSTDPASGRNGALTIRPKITKFSKRRQIARKFPGKMFQKIRKFWNFRKRTIQSKIPEIPPSGVSHGIKLFLYEILGNLGKPREVFLFLKFVEYGFPFDSLNFRRFKLEFLVEWKSHLSPTPVPLLLLERSLQGNIKTVCIAIASLQLTFVHKRISSNSKIVFGWSLNRSYLQNFSYERGQDIS